MNFMTCRRSGVVCKLESITSYSPFLENYISLYGRLDATFAYIYIYIHIYLFILNYPLKHAKRFET